MWICKNLIRKDRSKVSISKKIKQLGIVLIKVGIFLKRLMFII